VSVGKSEANPDTDCQRRTARRVSPPALPDLHL